VLDGSYLASVIILIDEAQHDSGPQCFICMPDEIELSITIDSVTVSGPAPWVEVSGDLNDDGSFTAAGRGTVAGFPGIAVTLAGTLTAEGLSAEYTMGAEGGLPGGLPIVYQVDGERMASELAQDALVEIASFLQTFNEAFAAGDVETLLANLHSEVFERYGEEPCRAYLEITVENPIMIEPLSVIMFGPWEYERDGVTSTIEDVYTIDAEITVRGETNRRDFHLAQSEEGVLTWFTDCGTPQ
jgi:hypothetical protein